jgi:hypothetical protein
MAFADQLRPFFAELRSSGFSIGLAEQQRALDLLLHLEVSGTMPQNSGRLCNMLAAVLCTTPEQQT